MPPTPDTPPTISEIQSTLLLVRMALGLLVAHDPDIADDAIERVKALSERLKRHNRVEPDPATGS
jgi:hypothetical protein